MITHRFVHNSFGKYDVVRPWSVSGKVDVPTYIPQPSYSQTSVPQAEPETPEIKDTYQIECMRDSCKLASYILRQVNPLIKVIHISFVLHKMS